MTHLGPDSIICIITWQSQTCLVWKEKCEKIDRDFKIFSSPHLFLKASLIFRWQLVESEAAEVVFAGILWQSRSHRVFNQKWRCVVQQ